MAKKQKAKSKKLVPTAQSGSSLRSTIIGTMFNMVATTATFGSVLLCLIVAKRFI
jgi:hypothetical protein